MVLKSVYLQALLISVTAHALVLYEFRGFASFANKTGQGSAQVITLSLDIGEESAQEPRAQSRESPALREEAPKPETEPTVNEKAGMPKRIASKVTPSRNFVADPSDSNPSRSEGALLGKPQYEEGPLDAKLIGINPQYPRFARQHGQEGRVLCKVFITSEGDVSRVEIAKSSGYSLLDEAALSALREAKLETSRTKTNTFVDISFAFKLTDG